ncbi:MAG: YcaO-like family protein [Egibacteraceae bacterium]
MNPAIQTAEAVYYRGRAHQGTKRFWRGTQRSCAPAETLARIRPSFDTAGLTRLADITGLDRIGIPVTLAIRPNSNTLSTSSGKGFTTEAALASGAMEAIELFHAEECALPTVRMPYADLESQGWQPIPREQLPLTKHAIFSERWPYTWTHGWDLLQQVEIVVPLAMVHMALGPHRIHELHTFQLSSNGLASGNTFLEAVNAALFEVIERDAVTCHRVAWERIRRPPPVVDPETIEHSLVQELLERLRQAQIGVVLFDCTVDTAVPVYMAYVYDLLIRQLGVYCGYGAHLDPEIAMIRALTEAVQSRLIYIAGSRDDVFRHSYLRLQRDDGRSMVARMRTLRPTVDARDRVSTATPTFEGDTLCALRNLRAAGIEHIVVLDLSRADFPIHVVKVLVPGLEGYMFDFYAPGRRADRFVRSLLERGHLPRSVSSPG